MYEHYSTFCCFRVILIRIIILLLSRDFYCFDIIWAGTRSLVDVRALCYFLF